MPNVNIDIPNPDQILPALRDLADWCRTAENGGTAQEHIALIDAFTAALGAAAAEATERALFDAHWSDYAAQVTFDSATDRERQYAGFTEGWARARLAGGTTTVYPIHTTNAKEPTDG